MRNTSLYRNRYIFPIHILLIGVILLLAINNIYSDSVEAEEYAKISSWFSDRSKLVSVPEGVGNANYLGNGYPKKYNVILDGKSKIEFIILSALEHDPDYITYISTEPITIRQALTLLNGWPAGTDELSEYKKSILIPKDTFTVDDRLEVFNAIDVHLKSIDNAYVVPSGNDATRILFKLGARLKGANVRALSISDMRHGWGENGIMPEFKPNHVINRTLCWPTQSDRRSLRDITKSCG